ncbi:type II secretion system protein D [Geobacter sp. OR-1]|uniref:type II secretion system secretin GspD n=1 Tax=Geobacter sp. OR-1 TaxID=1266765 RepID=UPI0005422D25|nr:type II secretion system secretin GspD [Geobacter sp. OR-1]GAM08222.1 type II secretion system protein D [Geobacter sp. OR-1]
MPARKRLNNILMLIFGSSLILGGCAGQKPTPPYFKEFFEASGDSEAPEARIDEKSADTVAAPKAAQQKPVVKIITIPNPLQKEAVAAPSEPVASRRVENVDSSEEEPQKPLELTAQAAAGDVQIVVENMPLYDFVNLAFGEVLKLNYTISQDVQSAREKINLNMNSKMPGKAFFPFAVDLLRKNKLSIKEENQMLFVGKEGGAQEKVAASPDIYVGNTVPQLSPQKRITLVLTPSYVSSNQIMQIVKQLQFGSDVRIEALTASQAIAVSGSVASLRKIVALFNQLDRVTFSQRSISLLYFDYVNALDFDKKMREVLPTMGIPVGKSPNDPGLLTVPFEKINALLLVSQNKEWLDAVLTWKEKLDTVESLGDELQLFVYHPKNRPAEELVDVLKSLSGGVGAPSQTGQPLSASPATAAKPAPPSAGSTAIPNKSFSAILDKGRNAVVVSASPPNYKLVRNILQQLDTPPRQVLIEATIMEVTLTDNLQYGVEWLIKNRINKGGDVFSGIMGTMGGLALGTSGFSYAVTQQGGDLTAKLNAFAKDSRINIVSTPHIATLDGKEASITVGTEVPIVTSEASAADLTGSTGGTGTTTAPSVLRSIQYRNTGVILRVKPTITSEGSLTIDIGQELSEAQNNSVSNIDSPMILNRSIKTTLAVKSGETVLLGGLISSNKSNGDQKIPILGDIPLLGNLFKTTSKGETKTELIVQITPYILNDTDQLEDITSKFKDSLFRD